MNGSPTMEVRGHGKHRSLTMKKVENGYVVEASFQVTRVDNFGSPGKTYKDTERREFVFSQLSDAVAFVNEYMTRDTEELEC